mgnify:CR=1 FL=1
MASISVLGGGVSGVTTATALSLLGHDVELYTDRRADHAYGSHVPMMASLYPAASVIPHSVTVDDPAAHLAESQALFDVLRRAPRFGVRRQLHFEMFEPEAVSTVTDPAYAPGLARYARCEIRARPERPSPALSAPMPPLRPGAARADGWRFDATFVETPVYLRALFDLFEGIGGTIKTVHVTADRLRKLPGDAFVNALGGTARDVFPDPRPSSYLRGVLLLVDSPGLPAHVQTGAPVSYNYTPDPAVYAQADGSAAGVYAYPRRDVWVLGGSKQAGTIEAGKWVGPSITGDTRLVPGLDDSPPVEVPEPVIHLNDQLLQGLTGASIRGRDMRATFGYRFARDLDGEGVRFGCTEAPDGRPVAHNTGHGGAGVTLSWSSALRVAQTLHDALGLSATGPAAAPAISGPPVAAPLTRALRQRLATLGDDAPPR